MDETREVECGVSPGFPKRILKWCAYITDAARDRGLKPDLVASVIWVESRGNPKAHSRSDARGLMQIVPRWHPDCDASRLYEPEYNIRCGTRILASLVSTHGLEEGLDRYYRGNKNREHWYSRLILSVWRKMGTY